jgi:AcrR family transcriptional regulator
MGRAGYFWNAALMRQAWGEIAREARVSKGTLYVYFKSKEELFEAIVEEQCNAQAEQIFTFDSNESDVEAVLTRLGDAFVHFMCRRVGGISPLRTVMAIADRMPELGAMGRSLPAC